MTVISTQKPAEAQGQAPAADYLWNSPPAGRPRRLPGALVVLLSVLVIGALGMLYLLQTNHVANLGYEMSALQREREAALVEQQRLSAQIAGKQALPAVDSTARFELGMQPVDDYVFLDVELPPAVVEAEPESTPEEGPSTLQRFWNRLTGSSGNAEGPAGD